MQDTKPMVDSLSSIEQQCALFLAAEAFSFQSPGRSPAECVLELAREYLKQLVRQMDEIRLLREQLRAAQQALPIAGRIRIPDPQTGDPIYVEPSDPRGREAMEKALDTRPAPRLANLRRLLDVHEANHLFPTARSVREVLIQAVCTDFALETFDIKKCPTDGTGDPT